MDTNKEKSISNFIANCNEFMTGKFLFASSKLVSILEDINQSEHLLELFTQCSEGFDYSLESTKAFIKTPTKPGVFNKPEELDKFLALTFALLKDINEEKIDFNIFVSKYFGGLEELPPTQNFARLVITPFKETVAKYFELDDSVVLRQQIEPQKQEEIEEKPEEEAMSIDLTAYYDQIIAISQNLLMLVKENGRIKQNIKTDASFILGEIISACKSEDIEKAYVLIVAFKYMQKHLRGTKHLIEELLFVLKQLENL